jgi:hypothetical protein
MASNLNPNAEVFVPSSSYNANITEEDINAMDEIDALLAAEEEEEDAELDAEVDLWCADDTDFTESEDDEPDVPVIKPPTQPALTMVTKQSRKSCRWGVQCRGYANGKCPFEHVCHFGTRCNRPECMFAHPN